MSGFVFLASAFLGTLCFKVPAGAFFVVGAFLYFVAFVALIQFLSTAF